MPMPNLSASGSSGASGENAGKAATSFDMPFSFDNSGWVINNRGSGTMTATGAQGQGGGGSLLGGMDTQTLLIVGAVAFVLLRKK